MRIILLSVRLSYALGKEKLCSVHIRIYDPVRHIKQQSVASGHVWKIVASVILNVLLGIFFSGCFIRSIRKQLCISGNFTLDSSSNLVNTWVWFITFITFFLCKLSVLQMWKKWEKNGEALNLYSDPDNSVYPFLLWLSIVERGH